MSSQSAVLPSGFDEAAIDQCIDIANRWLPVVDSLANNPDIERGFAGITSIVRRVADSNVMVEIGVSVWRRGHAWEILFAPHLYPGNGWSLDMVRARLEAKHGTNAQFIQFVGDNAVRFMLAR